MVKTKKEKIRLRRWVWIVFIICSGVGLLISEVIIFKWRDDSKQIEEQIERYRNRTYPAIIPIPSSSGSTGYGVANIKKDVEKAVGTDILFND